MADAKNDCGDEEILENWEDFEDTGELDKRLQELKSNEESEDQKSSGPSKVGKVQEDSTRTQYQPQVKILKRQVNENGYGEGALNRKTQVKSLEERQAEYAKARERIMGSSYSNEESEECSAPVTVSTSQPSYKSSDMNR